MSQNREILRYLKAGHSLTPIDALAIFKTFRLASRISDLKKEGHPIKSTLIHDGDKYYASYKIEEKKESYAIPQTVSESRAPLERDCVPQRWPGVPGTQAIPSNKHYTRQYSSSRSLSDAQGQELLF